MTFRFLKFDGAKVALPLPAFARISKDGRMISESRTCVYSDCGHLSVTKLRRGLPGELFKGCIKG